MKYHIITLGCPKNSVDSEGMHGLLSEQGHAETTDANEADVIIVNTCSFIAAARDETVNVLREVAENKSGNQRLIAAGCMGESHPELIDAVSGVDARLSTRQWMNIADIVGMPGTPKTKNLIPLQAIFPNEPAPAPVTPDIVEGGYADWRTQQIRRKSSNPSAYLKISDGCNLRCAFCTIPSFKGDMRSKAMGAILGEARELVAQGVKEIVLVAQHLTDYGRDLKIADGLATLLDELCGVLPQDVWVRMMYAYPHGVTPKLIETMAKHPQICHYLDMPLQHAHPDTLRRMRRPPDTDRTKRIIRDLRAAMPDLAVRSTFIVGYPGETETEFRALLDFLAEVKLDRVGVFRYSQEPGTPAAELGHQVDPDIIERRWHEVMLLQQSISAARNKRLKGRTLRVLVEGQGETEDGDPIAVGRSFRDAPEIDGQVFIYGTAPVGKMLDVRVTQTTEYDVWGKPARLQAPD